MHHWIREMTTKKQRRLATGCTRCMQQLQDAEAQQYTHNDKSDKGPTSNSKGTKRIRIDLTHQLGGNIVFPRQGILLLLLRHPGGNRPTAGGQHGIGHLHHGVKSDFLSFHMRDFRLQEMQFPSNRWVCKQVTVRAHVFLMRTFVVQVAVVTDTHFTSCLA